MFIEGLAMKSRIEGESTSIVVDALLKDLRGYEPMILESVLRILPEEDST